MAATSDMAVFVDAVAHTFATIGDVTAVEAMPGSTNRLWRFRSGRADFVVKELVYDTPADLGRRGDAAAFEQRVHESGDIEMALPVRDVAGDVFAILPGSRGAECGVRVHRWRPDPPATSVDEGFALSAGAALGRIEAHGAAWSTQESGALGWWAEHVDAALDRALRADFVGRAPGEVRSLVDDASELVRLGEASPGPWVFTHCDHKPDNSLDAGGVPVVLDWDECGHCHPRLEAVESALRWADPEVPDRGRFCAFLDGYDTAGGATTASLEAPDFAKCVAGAAGWFAFQTRRAFGDWDEPPDARAEAEAGARWALDGLERMLRKIPVWATWR